MPFTEAGDLGPGTVWGYGEGQEKKKKELSLVWNVLSLKCLLITQVKLGSMKQASENVSLCTET